MTEKIIEATRKLLKEFVKLSQLSQIVVAVALTIFAFSMGQCESDSKLNKFRAEFSMLQEQAEKTKQFADSAKTEVVRLSNESKQKDATITKLSLKVELGNQSRERLRGELSVLEDSLESAMDTAQVVQIQEGIIYNLKDQLETAECTITTQREIITAQQFKITKLDSAIALTTQRGDSLQNVVNNLINMPKPPRQCISKKTAGIVAFTAGVIVGDKLARR